MNIPLNIDWQQILLHLMNFAILAGGLYVLLYRPVKDFMDKRAAHYREMETLAQQKIDEAEAMKSQYEAQLKSADDDIAKTKAEAQQATQEAMRQQMDDARKQADKIISDAHRTAERDRTKILQDAQKEVQSLAITAAEKLVMQSDGDAFDQFLTAAERGTSHAEEPDSSDRL